jgi:lipid-A-disaccharide synthase
LSFDLWITSNSPGEVSTWVGGVVPWIARLRPRWKVRLALVPCPYASGAEKRVALGIAGVHEVFSPWETTRWFFGAHPPAWPRARQGLVLFLGGDPWHALLLKKKLAYPVAGYFEHAGFWTRFFDHVAYAYGQENALGNLMVDRVSTTTPPPRGARPLVGLFPGSRPWQLRLTLGRYLLVAETLASWGIDCVLLQSPYVTDRDLDRALRHPFRLGLPVAKARIEPDRLILQGGLVVPKRPGGQSLEGLDMAITIPGTNTAELACAGIPFVVTLHPLAYLAGGGLAGIIERLPLPNAWKVPLRRRKLQRLRYTALPNQVAGRAIAPELILEHSLQPISEQIRQWVEDPQQAQRIRQQLQGVMGPPGATLRLAEWIVKVVDEQTR